MSNLAAIDPTPEDLAEPIGSFRAHRGALAGALFAGMTLLALAMPLWILGRRSVDSGLFRYLMTLPIVFGSAALIFAHWLLGVRVLIDTGGVVKIRRNLRQDCRWEDLAEIVETQRSTGSPLERTG